MLLSWRDGAESECSASPSDGDHLIILNELDTNPSSAAGRQSAMLSVHLLPPIPWPGKRPLQG